MFECNACSGGLMALHLPNCLNYGCKSQNLFKVESKPDPKVWNECLKELNRMYNWAGQAQYKLDELNKTNN